MPRGTLTRFIDDERWRVAATYEGSGTTPKTRYVHHAAGLAGFGGSSYIDGLILMDADASGDSTLETRQYILQNWRADVAVIVQESGSGAVRVIQWNDYDAYGRARSIPWIDYDFNGDDGIDDLDTTDFLTAYGLGDPSADINRDDAIDDLDTAAWFASFSSGDTIVSEPNAYTLCRMAYAGYVADGFDKDLYHVRHRVYDTNLGRWTMRDPLMPSVFISIRTGHFAQYSNGPNIYHYALHSPIVYNDPSGLDVWIEYTNSMAGFHQRICVHTWNEDCTLITGKY